MQKLTLPIKNNRLTASIKTPYYKKVHGFEHYGCDIVNSKDYFNRYFLASGEGMVRGFGYDTNCGNVLIIEYQNCYNNRDKKLHSIIFRYFHLEKCYVILNQKVDGSTVLGRYGNTGRYGGSDPHLHLETDSDLRYIWHTPTLYSGRYLLKGRLQGANDRTVFNPIDFLHIAPNQSYKTNPDRRYIKNEDLFLPKIIIAKNHE